MNNRNDNRLAEVSMLMHPDTFAHLGEGHIGYVKPIRSEDVAQMFPDAPLMKPGMRLFALHGADGRPILLAETREAAVANAWDQELVTVSVH